MSRDDERQLRLAVDAIAELLTAINHARQQVPEFAAQWDSESLPLVRLRREFREAEDALDQLQRITRAR